MEIYQKEVLVLHSRKLLRNLGVDADKLSDDEVIAKVNLIAKHLTDTFTKVGAAAMKMMGSISSAFSKP